MSRVEFELEADWIWNATQPSTAPSNNKVPSRFQSASWVRRPQPKERKRWRLRGRSSHSISSLPIVYTDRSGSEAECSPPASAFPSGKAGRRDAGGFGWGIQSSPVWLYLGIMQQNTEAKVIPYLGRADEDRNFYTKRETERELKDMGGSGGRTQKCGENEYQQRSKCCEDDEESQRKLEFSGLDFSGGSIGKEAP
ncbi:hypothetical protein B0H17DRAFT_1137878 [Mycena rosella]|uniref:Uncharacterized protein n=1 Tax=Mycena rosella TaxID=1033263 RepID=A0AAD7D7G8_MYCRO|nr:hypothetical protein B0H17DRAFT_1137878 [Mycena rosella]